MINRPNPELWARRSDRQIFITAPSDRSPTNGPALSVTALIPDLHHYSGRGGRVFPLWRDAEAREANIPPKLLPFLTQRLGELIAPEEFIAYIVAVAVHPAFTASYQKDLSTPGLRIAITADRDTFKAVAPIGERIIWLHTFGERLVDPPGIVQRSLPDCRARECRAFLPLAQFRRTPMIFLTTSAMTPPSDDSASARAS